MKHRAALAASIPLLAGLGGSLGCATSYTPRPGPRLSIVVENGTPGYYKLGHVYPQGFLGSGLVDAVAGVPAAAAHAEAYRNLSIGGFVLDVVGAAGIGVGAGITGLGASQSTNNNTAWIGIGVIIGGAVVSVIGSALTASGQMHQIDAINVYNDAVEPVWAPAGVPMALPPGWRPMPSYAPGTQLQPGPGAPSSAPPAYPPPPWPATPSGPEPSPSAAPAAAGPATAAPPANPAPSGSP